jgi:hypothetical protein
MAQMRRDSREGDMVIGLLVWAVLIGAVLAYQGLALVHGGDRWPAFTDLLDTAMRHTAGRWLLFGLWLWFGWHLFFRDGRFFLRG